MERHKKKECLWLTDAEPRRRMLTKSRSDVTYVRLERCRSCGAERHDMRDWLSPVHDLESPADQYSLLLCGACGLIATDPYPSDDTIAALYASGDSSDYEFPEAGPITKIKEFLAKRRIRTIAAQAGVLPASILDYGTGAGRYAWAAARAFPQSDVVGADLADAPPAGSYFEAAPGNLRYRQYARVVESRDRFDLILARHVLEHMADPVAELRKWIDMLSERGVLYLEVPNTLSVTAKLLKERWPLLYVPKHLSHFTRDTLARTIVTSNGVATIAGCEMPMMGNVLAIAMGRSRFDSRFRIPGLLLHPVQLGLEAFGRQGTCLSALVRRRPRS